MTSKNLFFKLMKEDLKRRIWTIALSVLAFFLCLPVYCTMKLSSYIEGKSNTRKEILEMLKNHMGANNELLIFITIAGAVICAFSGFHYLLSKKKADFYHSIPVRREVLFIIRYINGLLIYLLPYVINIILCLIAIGANGFLNSEISVVSLCGIGISLLFYTFLYTIATFAVMLTGNLFVSCLGTGVFFTYGFLLAAVKEAFFEEYFITYFPHFRSELFFCSPLGFYAKTVNINDKTITGKLVGVALITVALLCCTIFLYRKRPSEAAGKAMSFAISKPIIKFLLVVPITLGGAIFCKNAVNGSSSWFIFGMIFSFLLISALIEIIYNFDIRKAFGNWKHLLVNIGVIMFISVIFKFDVFRYDTYIPREGQIKSMAISINSLDSNFDYMELDNVKKYAHANKIDYELEKMVLTDYASAYALAKNGLNNVNKRKSASRANTPTDGKNTSFSFSVKYVLHNGKKVYRNYELPVKQSMDLISKLYVNKEFKKIHFDMELLDTKYIGTVSCSNNLTNKLFSLNSSEKAELLKIYQSELNALTLDDVVTYLPIANLSFSLPYDNTIDYGSINFDVYPTFQNTISFLQNHGFDTTNDFTVEDIKKITLETYDNRTLNGTDPNKTAYDETTFMDNEDLYRTVTYSDKPKIAELFSNLIPQDYCDNNSLLIFGDRRIDVAVVIGVDNFGNDTTIRYTFKEGTIPDYVIKDLTK